jgi:PHD/YefM family antitoxin component YafN of YafNO toxin-antitoxin module
MPKTISTSEASADLDTVVTWVEAHRGEVILEQDGTARAAIISIAEYEEFAALREKQREERKAALLAWAEEARRTMSPSRPAPELTAEERQDLLAKLAALEAQIGDRNADLTDAEIEALAVEVGREARHNWAMKLQAGAYDKP